jgi:hypothetical protein
MIATENHFQINPPVTHLHQQNALDHLHVRGLLAKIAEVPDQLR